MKSWLATVIVSLLFVPFTQAQITLKQEVKKHYILITAQTQATDISWDIPPTLDSLSLNKTQLIIISPDVGTYHIAAAIVTSDQKPMIATIDLTVPPPPPPPDPLEQQIQGAYQQDTSADRQNNIQILAKIYSNLTPLPATITTNDQLHQLMHNVVSKFMDDNALKSVRTIIANDFAKKLPGDPNQVFDRQAAEQEIKNISRILGNLK